MGSPTLTAAQLAKLVGGTLHGDGGRTVSCAGTLEETGPDGVAWVGSAKHLPRLAGSRAGVVLIPAGAAFPAERTVIEVADPDLAMCAALSALAPAGESVPPGIDPAAHVAPDAVVTGAAIGPHVRVGAGAVVGPGTQLHAGVYVGQSCRIGAECTLWPNVVLREHTVLGDRVVIHANATIGADGFGYLQRGGRHVKIPQTGRVIIEDDVEVGANSCIDRARSGVTRIGRGTKIDNLVQIGHNAHIGEDCIIVAQVGISGSVTLGAHVVLGGKVGIIDHLTVGPGAMLAAASVVFNDLRGGKVYRGQPAVERTVYGREVLSLRRLPKLLAELRTLVKRVEQLESAANDRA
jgi:UDP-3-O-[3-hydroxymyristoyl] glucosamine N-acyltransferase